jgi:hypothetical protein
MSDPNPDSQAGAAQAFKPSAEFMARLNDMLELANRISRKHDSAHGQVALAHALSRFSAHHYRLTVKKENDSEAERKAFAEYMGSMVAHLILQHMPEMAGKLPAAE